MTTRSPQETVDAYFAAITAHDARALREVFAEDAELVTPTGRFIGPAAIADFYNGTAFAAADLQPRPGPLLIAGDRVAVEILLQMHGQVSRVADVFEIRHGVIRRLAVYLGGSV